MARYLLPFLPVALAALLFASPAGAEEGKDFQFFCGTPEIEAALGRTLPPAKNPPRLEPEKISGDFLYQGFFTVRENGAQSKLPFSFSLRIKDGIIEGEAILESKGTLAVTGKAYRRGIDLTLKNETTVLELVGSPLNKNLRGYIENKTAHARWVFSADLSSSAPAVE